MKLSAKLAALPTLDLESMACGLRSMKKGQKSLLAAIEGEIARRRVECGGVDGARREYELPRGRR